MKPSTKTAGTLTGAFLAGMVAGVVGRQTIPGVVVDSVEVATLRQECVGFRVEARLLREQLAEAREAADASKAAAEDLIDIARRCSR